MGAASSCREAEEEGEVPEQVGGGTVPPVPAAGTRGRSVPGSIPRSRQPRSWQARTHLGVFRPLKHKLLEKAVSWWASITGATVPAQTLFTVTLPACWPWSSKLHLVQGPIAAEGESLAARVSAALCITFALAPPFFLLISS